MSRCLDVATEPDLVAGRGCHQGPRPLRSPRGLRLGQRIAGLLHRLTDLIHLAVFALLIIFWCQERHGTLIFTGYSLAGLTVYFLAMACHVRNQERRLGRRYAAAGAPEPHLGGLLIMLLGVLLYCAAVWLAVIRLHCVHQSYLWQAGRVDHLALQQGFAALLAMPLMVWLGGGGLASGGATPPHGA